MAWLVIGGTGMLAGTTAALAAAGEDVWLISRQASRVAPLRAAAGAAAGRLHFAAADYTDVRAFATALRQATETKPPCQVLAWMVDGPWWDVLFTTMRAIHGGQPWDLFRVRGSAATHEPLPPMPPDVSFHVIILGFFVERGSSRWLSHAEIADGVLAALTQPAPRTVVGVVAPWSLRPPY